MVVFTIVLGIAGYVAADRLRLPAIVVLMLLGILAGPEVLNLIAPSELGSALRVIVSTAVAIVVFEGGM
ncbi:MAG TPA: cation:proton antiporter, partial [Aggregatilineales bacterium]|nr:cation:proton antiporter [Aggregatilineales bacterium]